jgi:uncharacterized protein (DUF4415 family)
MKGGSTLPKSKRAGGVKEPEAPGFDIADEDIDFSDIPELDAAWFKKAKLRLPVTKEAVSIRLDSDVLDVFKAQGRGYQTRINAVLRKYLGISKLRRNTYRIYHEDGDVGVYFGTDEVKDLVGAVEHSAELAQELDDSANWKWLILALHNAVQGACVCALRGDDSIGHTMLTPKSGRKKLESLEVSRKSTGKASYSADRLDEMLELYEKVSSADWLPAPQRLARQSKRDRSIKLLNDLRNKFVHFVPQGWSLELSGMPLIVDHACEVIEHLALVHPTFARHMDDRIRKRLADALTTIRDGVAAWAAGVGIKSA